MKQTGFDPENNMPPVRRNIERFVELHIEQGMILEKIKTRWGFGELALEIAREKHSFSKNNQWCRARFTGIWQLLSHHLTICAKSQRNQPLTKRIYQFERFSGRH
jgi:HD-like signal output (HDOD) protein